MKTKLDFVTNSSSSSFVAIGISFDLCELFESKEDMVKEILFNYGVNENEIDKDTAMDYKYDIIDQILNETGLLYAIKPYSKEVMIGLPYSIMDEYKTLFETKQIVKDLIKKIFDMDVEPDHIEECWIDN